MTSGEGEVEQNGEGSLGIVRFAGGYSCTFQLRPSLDTWYLVPKINK